MKTASAEVNLKNTAVKFDKQREQYKWDGDTAVSFKF